MNKMMKRQFDDVEVILHEQGEQAAHLAAQDEKILAALAELRANTDLTKIVEGLAAEIHRLVVQQALQPGCDEALSAVSADAKAARTAAESAFVATQALAAVATAKPGPAAVKPKT